MGQTRVGNYSCGKGRGLVPCRCAWRWLSVSRRARLAPTRSPACKAAVSSATQSRSGRCSGVTERTMTVSGCPRPTACGRRSLGGIVASAAHEHGAAAAAELGRLTSIPTLKGVRRLIQHHAARKCGSCSTMSRSRRSRQVDENRGRPTCAPWLRYPTSRSRRWRSAPTPDHPGGSNACMSAPEETRPSAGWRKACCAARQVSPTALRGVGAA